jgi:hypothetical protein
MQGGDISNETSPRIIVMIDVVLGSDLEVINRMFLPSVTERKVKLTKNLALSQLWNMANKYGLSVELAAFASELWTQKQLDDVMDKLDRRGANPFNYAELYNDIEDFIGELPYRSNLKGVIDIRERVARYGSYGIELENL